MKKTGLKNPIIWDKHSKKSNWGLEGQKILAHCQIAGMGGQLNMQLPVLSKLPTLINNYPSQEDRRLAKTLVSTRGMYIVTMEQRCTGIRNL